MFADVIACKLSTLQISRNSPRINSIRISVKTLIPISLWMWTFLILQNKEPLRTIQQLLLLGFFEGSLITRPRNAFLNIPLSFPLDWPSIENRYRSAKFPFHITVETSAFNLKIKCLISAPKCIDETLRIQRTTLLTHLEQRLSEINRSFYRNIQGKPTREIVRFRRRSRPEKSLFLAYHRIRIKFYSHRSDSITKFMCGISWNLHILSFMYIHGGLEAVLYSIYKISTGRAWTLSVEIFGLNVRIM